MLPVAFDLPRRRACRFTDSDEQFLFYSHACLPHLYLDRSVRAFEFNQ